MLRLLLDSEKKKTKESFIQLERLTKEIRIKESEERESGENYKRLEKEMGKMIDDDKRQRAILEADLKEMRGTIHTQREKINKMEVELLELQRKKEDHVDKQELQKLKDDNNNLLDELRRNMEELLKLESLEELKPMLEKKEQENLQLREEVDHLIVTVQEQKVKLTFDGERIESLQESLYKAGTKTDRQSETIEGLNKTKQDLQATIKRKDLLIEEKEKNVEQSLEAIESLKAVTKKLKGASDKLSKEKEDLGKKLDRVLGDLTSIKRNKDELQELYNKMELEYAGFKDIIAKKDEWIIKQGNEMRVIVDQLNAMKKKYSDYKQETETGIFP
jgi:chromosome segregation ATPase